jgi:hypothetical protein
MFNVTMTKAEAKQAIGATWLLDHASVREQTLSLERTVGSNRHRRQLFAPGPCVPVTERDDSARGHIDEWKRDREGNSTDGDGHERR